MIPPIENPRRASRTARIPNDEIIKMVDRFYEKVKVDDVLGPIFNSAIGDHWDEHMPKMYRFWSSVLNGSGLYSGNPMKAHISLKSKVELENFDRWLSLFHETLTELFCEDDVVYIFGKAENIAQSLSLGMFYNPASPHMIQTPKSSA
ncbi:group III truncated hemoglobin [Sneathiella sp.]|jgi:hemoglobin|uniref:group III truncated hemoglobin n=1 Tax=Sneathiella sp. TaxID=1964365 RepID=UPI0039E260F4